MGDGGQYEIVLEEVDAEYQPAAALYLSGAFSLPPASTRRIAAATPLAILPGLSEPQASAVLKELSGSLPDGVRLRVAMAGATSDIGKLDWPTPPKIYGRDLEEFNRAPEHSITACPSCGRLLKVTYDPGGGIRIGLQGTAGKTVMIPNPASVASDKDPLFSGFKPIAEGVGDLASLRSLQAGDSSFWMEARQNFFPAAGPEPVREPHGRALQPDAAKSTHRDGSGFASSRHNGLVAFMKQGLYSVVLSRTRDPQAVKMLSDIVGLDESEVRDLAGSRSLCVARNIALDEAQTLLARFRSLGANARIVKPM
ncbi:MAG: hypothetical protein LBJ46_05655 [Planctomycetota bacterium]|jgi:hypothetical protein|nr:hypothetical protein [Planctomycetota bacterium]